MNGLPMTETFDRPVAEQAKPAKIGAGWTQHQWFLKGLELADSFSTGSGSLDLQKAASCQVPKMADHQPCREQSPPPPSKLVRFNINSGEKENLIGTVEREGFDAFSDWYSALDRIYDITDLALVSEKPEPLVGDAHKVGTPGLSYLICKSPPQNHHATSSDQEDARIKAHEALVNRYQNRLLVTSLPNKAPGAAT